MTLEDFLSNYGGNAVVSIWGYCEERNYDYYTDVEDWELSSNNTNHYTPKCIAREPWWAEVKDRQIRHWNVIGGGMYKTELSITLE